MELLTLSRVIVVDSSLTADGFSVLAGDAYSRRHGFGAQSI
jgi:hypothetical protein